MKKNITSDHGASKTSTAPMMQIEANIPTSDIHVDAHGNVVIKNKELAHLIEKYLGSDDAKMMQRAAAHLLCCKLQCPMCQQQ